MDEIQKSTGPDLLGEALRALRITSAVYCRPECCDPWGVTIGEGPSAYFHIMTAGECLLDLPRRGIRAELAKGDIVILPYGDLHTLRDDERTPAPELPRPQTEGPAADHYEIVHLGGRKAFKRAFGVAPGAWRQAKE